MQAVLQILLLMSGFAAATDVLLATFDGAAETSKQWDELNDPVMGGQSIGTCSINSSGHFLVFDGEVANVPFLKAPGFIAVQSAVGKWPDASGVVEGDLILSIRSSTPEYTGFKVTFNAGSHNAKYSCASGGQLPFSRGCFKASFSVPAGNSFSAVHVPFESFTDKWDPYTGKPTKTCAQDKSVCPTAEALKGIQMFEFMAEGVLGKIHLEVQSISAGLHASPVKTTMMDTPNSIALWTSDGTAPHKWHSENDPVMGGKSSSTVEEGQGYEDYKGTTRIVPALKAPGFTIAMTEGFPFLSKYPDVSTMDGLTISVRNIGNFTGYKIAFCDSHINFYRCQLQSFKADLVIPSATDGGFQDVFVPWSKFSDKWDASTGKHTAENLPQASSLKSITQLQIWTEAVEGDFHLQFRYILASKAPDLTLVV